MQTNACAREKTRFTQYFRSKISEINRERKKFITRIKVMWSVLLETQDEYMEVH